MMKTVQHPILRVKDSRPALPQAMAQTLPGQPLPTQPLRVTERAAAVQDLPFNRDLSAASAIRIGVARVPSRRLNLI